MLPTDEHFFFIALAALEVFVEVTSAPVGSRFKYPSFGANNSDYCNQIN